MSIGIGYKDSMGSYINIHTRIQDTGFVFKLGVVERYYYYLIYENPLFLAVAGWRMFKKRSKLGAWHAHSFLDFAVSLPKELIILIRCLFLLFYSFLFSCNEQTILLGDSGVGKTSLIVKYQTGDFRIGSFSATVGIAMTVSSTKLFKMSSYCCC